METKDLEKDQETSKNENATSLLPDNDSAVENTEPKETDKEQPYEEDIDSDDNEDSDNSDNTEKKKKKSWLSKLSPWILAAIVSAAVILAIVIPERELVDARLCDSALLASQAYIEMSQQAIAVNDLDEEVLENRLHDIELQYKKSVEKVGGQYYYSKNLRHDGWALVIAYLRLHKRKKAIKILQILEEQYERTDFGKHCAVLLKFLE